MKPFDELSARQRKILRFIDQYTVDNGYPPTIREIGDATDTASTSVVNYNLNKLVDEGYLDREARVSRGVRLIARIPNSAGSMFRGSKGVRASETKSFVPLIGNIAAGRPIPLPDDIGQHIDEEDMLEVGMMMLGGVDPSEVFALRVKGDSMIDAMNAEDDIVLFRKQSIANNGDMVAVWLADRSETTLKKFYHEGNRIRLEPANENYEPIYVDAAYCQIHGKVLSVLRRLK
ncbi:MAG: transcriptional repressor LexA [Chloroflexota bacterium]